MAQDDPTTMPSPTILIDRSPAGSTSFSLPPKPGALDHDDDIILATAGQSPDGGRCHWLQALEDAIKFRLGRASAPCGDCGIRPQLCDEHARDLDLITAYQWTAQRLVQAAQDTVRATAAGR